VNGIASSLQNRDRYTDYVTRVHRKLFVLSAGNIIYADGETNSDYTSNKAYNAVIVGGTYETGAVMDGNRPSTESCAPAKPMGSAFRNDTNGQEIPNITAVGHCVGLWGGMYYTGTSFSAPAVSGIAAGLMEYNTNLQTWPEGMKAILLASPYGPGSSSPDGCDWRQVKNAQGVCNTGDGRDGTGLVNGFWAKRMADPAKKLRNNAVANWGHDYGTMRASEFDSATLQWSSSWNAISGTSCTPVNRRMRVALAWDSNPVCDAGTRQCSSDQLKMNLDLRVYRMPDNVLVAQSETAANSYEHVDLALDEQRGACSPSGPNYTYKIVVRLANKSSLAATEETPFGIAWHTYLPS
jgi:hypothetical protein